MNLAEKNYRHLKNNTWKTVNLPPHKKAIHSKWVFWVKYNAKWEIDKFKANSVDKGYNQKLRVYSPVARIVTMRLFLAVAASHSWLVHQVDINNAYLHGYINEEIYVTPPEGYAKASKSLYIFKEARRHKHKELSSAMLNYGFVRLTNT